MIGEAAKSEELTAVLSELLERERVTLEFEQRARFRPSTLLAASEGDARVWVYISTTPSVAKLYFRGPYGNRFLLRKLELNNGLDEVGRELIAQVVDTSILTLLRSEAGLSREEVKTDLAHPSEPDANSTEEPPALEKRATAQAVPSPAGAPSADEGGAKSAPSTLELELGARGAAQWTGSDLGTHLGAGAETALSYNRSKGLFLRGRLLFEYGFGQAISTPALNATVQTTALRAGVDLGTAFGVSAFAFGLGFGADLARIAPESALDASLVLAEESTATIPIVRLEARYELTAGNFRMAAGLFADASLVDTHYDVRGEGGQERIAEPWSIRPGVLVVVGTCFGL
ncbi:MAG TPA: hypothetical protein VFZ53_10835 [Polyangiaceae bacterium]